MSDLENPRPEPRPYDAPASDDLIASSPASSAPSKQVKRSRYLVLAGYLIVAALLIPTNFAVGAVVLILISPVLIRTLNQLDYDRLPLPISVLGHLTQIILAVLGAASAASILFGVVCTAGLVSISLLLNAYTSGIQAAVLGLSAVVGLIGFAYLVFYFIQDHYLTEKE